MLFLQFKIGGNLRKKQKNGGLHLYVFGWVQINIPFYWNRVLKSFKMKELNIQILANPNLALFFLIFANFANNVLISANILLKTHIYLQIAIETRSSLNFHTKNNISCCFCSKVKMENGIVSKGLNEQIVIGKFPNVRFFTTGYGYYSFKNKRGTFN